MSNILPILAIFLMLILTIIGDYFIKAAGLGPKYIEYGKFFLGMTTYALSAFGWFYVMKHMKLSVIGVFFAVGSILLLTLLGVIVFKEKLTSYEVFGIALGILSIVFLMRFS